MSTTFMVAQSGDFCKTYPYRLLCYYWQFPVYIIRLMCDNKVYYCSSSQSSCAYQLIRDN